MSRPVLLVPLCLAVALALVVALMVAQRPWQPGKKEAAVAEEEEEEYVLPFYLAAPQPLKGNEWFAIAGNLTKADHHSLGGAAVLDPGDLVIGVMSSRQTLKRALAVENTWKRWSPARDVVLYSAMPLLNASAVWDELVEGDREWMTYHRLGEGEDVPLRFPAFVDLGLPQRYDNAILPEVVAALRHMWAAYPNKRFYMKADDDTYVVVPNLLAALGQLDSTADLYVGLPLYGGSFNSGGAGYLLSHSAMGKLMNVIDECIAAHGYEGAPEDLTIGRCLALAGIRPMKTHFGLYYVDVLSMLAYCRAAIPEGLVQFPVTFHKVFPTMMYMYDYYLRVGRHHDNGVFTGPPLGMAPI